LLNVKRKFFNENFRPHLKEVKMGKHILFRQTELDEFINSMFDLKEVTPCQSKRSYRQDSYGGEIRSI